MLNKNYKRSCLISTFVLLSIMFIYWGNNEKYNDDKYVYTFGKITNRKIDIINTTSANKQALGVNVYVNQIKYRLEVTFEFYKNGEKYESTFYNDGNNTNYFNRDILKKNWKKFFKGKRIKIYYNKYNPLDSGINLSQLKKRNSKNYYLFSLISISTLLYLLFFSNFFINE